MQLAKCLNKIFDLFLVLLLGHLPFYFSYKENTQVYWSITVLHLASCLTSLDIVALLTHIEINIRFTYLIQSNHLVDFIRWTITVLHLTSCFEINNRFKSNQSNRRRSAVHWYLSLSLTYLANVNECINYWIIIFCGNVLTAATLWHVHLGFKILSSTNWSFCHLNFFKLKKFAKSCHRSRTFCNGPIFDFRWQFDWKSFY